MPSVFIHNLVILSIIAPNLLSVIMLSVIAPILLSVIMPNVIGLSVMGLFLLCRYAKCH